MKRWQQPQAVRPRMLWIDGWQRREFGAARRVAALWAEVVEVGDIVAAQAALVEVEQCFDWIVLATSYPGQYSEQQIDGLRCIAPLSRIVALLGSWCEGETRSGRPTPGVIRVYWHQWEQRLAWEASRWASGGRSTWALPVTAGEEERVLALAEDRMAPRSGPITICSDEFACAEWLSAVCRKAGYTPQQVRPWDTLDPAGVAAGIFDVGEHEERFDHLRRFVSALRPAPVVALIGFPRVEDRERAVAAGAASLLSKPLWIEDLLCEIDRLLGGLR